MAAGISISAIDRFQQLKKRSDVVTTQLSVLEGKVAAARDRYNEIMVELSRFGIGSIDELRGQIVVVEKQISQSLDEAEQSLVKMEIELNEINNKEARSTVAG